MRFHLFLLSLLKIITIFSVSYTASLMAQEAPPPNDLLTVSNNLMESAVVATDLFYLIYLILGTAFVTASIIKFFERRVNPLGVRISQVIFLMIAGLFLLAMPYIANTQQGLRSAVFPALFGS